jgi:hypothetical protein
MAAGVMPTLLLMLLLDLPAGALAAAHPTHECINNNNVSVMMLL